MLFKKIFKAASKDFPDFNNKFKLTPYHSNGDKSFIVFL